MTLIRYLIKDGSDINGEVLPPLKIYIKTHTKNLTNPEGMSERMNLDIVYHLFQIHLLSVLHGVTRLIYSSFFG